MRRPQGPAAALAALLVAFAIGPATADELPPGWGGSGAPEPPPPPAEAPPPPAETPPPSAEAPPTTAPPTETVTTWPTAPAATTEEAEPPPPPPEPLTEEEEIAEEDLLTTTDEKVENAVLPTCATTLDAPLLVFPHTDPATTFGNDFGFARPDDRRHRGIDIFSDKGTPVVAIADGVVTRTRTGASAGHYVVIEHADGWVSKYMHLDNDSPGTDDGALTLEMALAAGIEPGAEVVAGQLLGFVGDSGNAEATPPHTHFELWQGDRLSNPFACLDLAWDRQVRSWQVMERAF